MIVEDLTLHCFSISAKNLEQAMQVSGWDALWGMCAHTCSHAQACTKFISLSFPVVHRMVYKWYSSQPGPAHTHTPIHRQFIILYSIPTVCYMHIN